MKLYQTEKVNPLMGCLPMLLQIPVFFGLFHVLKWLNPFGADGQPIPDTGKTLYGWTVEKFDSAAVSRLFDAPIPARFADSATQLGLLDASGVTVKIVAGVLVLIMMFSTFMSSRQMILKTGWNPDSQQRMIQKLMLYGIPFSLLLSGWYFPSGVIVYWVTQNIFSFCQQYWVLRKYPPPVAAGAVPANTRNLFARIPVAGETAAPTKTAPPERPIPKAKGRAGFVNPQQPAKASNLFRRKVGSAKPAEQPSPQPVKSLGPKVGAKPAVAKASVAEVTEPTKKTVANGGSSNGSANGSVNGSASGRQAESKPGQTKSQSASGGTKTQSANGGAKAKSGAKSGRSGAKSGGSKKGQTSKKGGSRR
jgi:YidC/Oxa1 family membrane protein insertase